MTSKDLKIIIVGQGISGTFLSWFCYQANIDFIVIDDAKKNAPSRVAAGIINPVTGRRVVKVWLDDMIIPFAKSAYTEMGKKLQMEAIRQTDIIDFFPNPFMKESFLKKLSQQEDYIQLVKNETPYQPFFNYEFGIGSISPAYTVNLRELLPAWRSFLKKENKIQETDFDFSILKTASDAVQYDSVLASHIIFCDGVAGAANPFFSLLPFALNKGEALIIESPDLPTDHLYKKSMLLAPLAEKNLYWLGTNYIWEFEKEEPTKAFRENAEVTLKHWLKVPFKTIDHKAAVRPATVERRPFAGFHPLHKNVGILNGMGTKGCSLAPFFAHQLVQNIIAKKPILKEADVNRFQRVLMR